MMAFDAYELRARIAPTLVVCCPLVVPLAYITIKTSPNAVTGSLLGAVAIGMLYAFSLVIRYLGKQIEPSLWQSWGGPPTTVLLAGDKPGLSDSQRQLIKERCKNSYGVDLNAVSSRADLYEKIDQVFPQVRATIRKREPGGLWLTHDAEYGFWRNLYASIRLWAFVALGAALSGYFVILTSLSWGIVIIAQGIFFALVALIVGPHIKRKELHESADRYAQTAWLSFLEATDPKAKPI